MKTGSSLILFAAAIAAYGQTTPAPSFEVASVKLSAPVNFGGFGRGGPPPMVVKVDAGRLEIRMLSLHDVIMGAYRVKEYQLQGPDWMKSVMVDIEAKLPAGASEDQIPEMLQGLLADRFGLKAHRETKDQPVYDLIVSKGGPKMKDAAPSDDPAPASDPKAPDFGMLSEMAGAKMSGDPMKGMTITGLAQGGTLKMSMGTSGIHLESSSMNMNTLVTYLTQYLDRPVFDKTALKGNYQVALDMSMEDMMNFMNKSGFMGGRGGGPPPGAGDGQNPLAAMFNNPDASSGSSVLRSIQSLGLKLDPVKAPMSMVVVDSLEKVPSEN